MTEKTNNLGISEELLGLPDIRIMSSHIGSKGHVIIKIENTIVGIPCRNCGKPTDSYGRDVTRRVRHLPVFGRQTYIEFTPRRGRCSTCDNHPTTTQQSSWNERKIEFTKAYEQHILMSLIHSTIEDVCVKDAITRGCVQGIVDRYLSTGVDWSRYKTLGLLGLDEISLKKGYRDFVTVVTSRVGDEVSILGILKGREKITVIQFLKSIPKPLKKTVVAVCTDMYDGFIGAATEVFGVDIPVIVDRFHVAQLYRKCFVQLRKAELGRLRKSLGVDKYRKLQPAIAILCRNNSFYKHEERRLLEPLFKLSPAIKAGHKLCCQLTAIFNSHISQKKALREINKWILLVEKAELACFLMFTKTLKKYKIQILNYFKGRNTSGFVEGINNKLKVLKRRCYGIYNINHFFQRAFLDVSGFSFLNIIGGCKAK